MLCRKFKLADKEAEKLKYTNAVVTHICFMIFLFRQVAAANYSENQRRYKERMHKTKKVMTYLLHTSYYIVFFS